MPNPVQTHGFHLVDFHTHTIFSTDSLTTPERLVASARRKKLDKVAVTDHNEIQGAFRAQEIDPELIIVGCEIETSQGEILALFVEELIPPGLPPIEVINQLRDQGAFVSISHPFDPTRKGGWKLDHLLAILPFIDAIETFNARCMLPKYNWRATEFASENKLPGTHGSDAHAVFEIGRGALLLPPFKDASSLRKSLSKAVSPRLILSSPLVHFTSRFATWVKKTNLVNEW